MHLKAAETSAVRDEMQVLAELLNWHPNGQPARVLELGCGRGERARDIDARFRPASLLAAEVDASAHADNVARLDTHIEYAAFGAEDIPLPGGDIDIVLMFKSLHHVPGDRLDQALQEVHRVLRPGGCLYVSEPVFDGALNEVLRLFHDEEEVREAAFQALAKAVNGHQFKLQRELFFASAVRFATFDQFKAGIIDATHSRHDLNAAQLAAVAERFQQMADTSGDGFYFASPMRVDVLERV